MKTKHIPFDRIALAHVLALTLFLPSACGERTDKGPGGTLRIATTTSTYETGVLDQILAPFKKKYGVKIHIISVGTGKALKLGENGDVDLVLVHARKAEDEFVRKGFGVNRRDVMYNDFVILGPKSDPAKIAGLKKATDVMKRLHATRHIFVSRGDESGTHKKEKQLWALAGLKLSGKGRPWYLEAGQGMSATLRIADEKNGYLLIDRGTYLFQRKKTRLVLLYGDQMNGPGASGAASLTNPYGVIAVSPYRHPGVRYETAMTLIAWLTSPRCQQMIEEFRVNGEQLFRKNAERHELHH